MIKKIINFLNKYEISFLASVFALFFMGTIHIVLAIIDKSNYALCYALFYYIMMSGRIFIFSSFKFNKIKYVYLYAALILLTSLVPVTEAMVLKVNNNETTYFIYDWFIYVYAIYAFAKLTFAIINLAKKNTEPRKMLAFLSIISAVFTMFMFEFSIVRIFGNVNRIIHGLEISFILSIILLIIFEVIFFLLKFKSQLKYMKEIEKSYLDNDSK